MAVIKIPYKAHSGQVPVHQSHARFKVLDCGRRWGKDRCSIQDGSRAAFRMAEENRPRSLIPKVHVWSVAPSFPMLRQTWNELKAFWVPTGLIARKDEAELTLEFRNGILWELKSADKPESLVGVGLDLMIMTEAARVKPVAWFENIRPTLSSPKRGPGMSGQGLAIFNSTPRGRNWFYKDLWLRGQRTVMDSEGNEYPNPDYDPEWESWQFPTSSNPHINPAEVVAAQNELPAAVFQQEYLASFLEDAAGVFVNIGAQARGDWEAPQPGVQYAVGVDIAYQQDYTVITVMDVARQHVVHWERFQSPLWEEQAPRIERAAKEYNNAPILLDVTGIGFNSVELMRNRMPYGHRVEGYFFTQDSKEKLITQLQLAMQTKALTYPADLDVLRDEMLSYEYTYTKAGRFRYNAPPGQHDDAVVSLALALECTKLGPYEVFCGEY